MGQAHMTNLHENLTLIVRDNTSMELLRYRVDHQLSGIAATANEHR
jgi:hypothetical protein